MRMNIRKFITCLITLFIVVLNAKAEVVKSDITKLDYAIYLNDSTCQPGEELLLKLSMKNVNSISTWQADLVLPEGVTVTQDEFGEPAILLSAIRTNANRHSVSTNQMTDGRIRILCGSQSNKTFIGTDGEVATIRLLISSDIAAGIYPIILKDVLLVEPNQSYHELPQVVSTLEVKSAPQFNCDVNGDGVVNIKDVTDLVDHLLGK